MSTRPIRAPIRLANNHGLIETDPVASWTWGTGVTRREESLSDTQQIFDRNAFTDGAF
jgi:hypothetical protein